MAAKKASAKTTKKNHQLQIKPNEGETEQQRIAQVGLMPELQAMGILINLDSTSFEVGCLLEALQIQSEAINSGNMSRAESMLICQSHTLDSLFTYLTNKALAQNHMPNYEGFMRLALKAQNQCRMTLETLGKIKNPPVVYVKQANIANGPQQINNGVPVTHTAENQDQQNELLTVIHGETLDSSRTSETIGGNQAVAALEKQHRAKNGSRKDGGGA